MGGLILKEHAQLHFTFFVCSAIDSARDEAPLLLCTMLYIVHQGCFVCLLLTNYTTRIGGGNIFLMLTSSAICYYIDTSQISALFERSERYFFCTYLSTRGCQMAILTAKCANFTTRTESDATVLLSFIRTGTLHAHALHATARNLIFA